MTTLPATSRSLVRPPHRREQAIEALLFLAASLWLAGGDGHFARRGYGCILRREL